MRKLFRCFSTIKEINDVVIVSAVRTPMGSFRGSLAPLKVTQLGAIAIKEAVKKASVPFDSLGAVYMGIVCPAGCGQDSTKQSAVEAGVPRTVPTTTINKLCASGMKTIMCAAESLMLGYDEIIVAGGMESMSNVPFLLHRGEIPYGGTKVQDGLVFDGLTDPFYNILMGCCAENTAKKLSVTREAQDEYAIRSYRNTTEGYKNEVFKAELVPVVVPGKKNKPGIVIEEDEEYKRVKYDRIPTLPSAFQENGTVTVANSSSINDGAAACVLTTLKIADKMKIKPLARIVGFADAATDSIDFPIAPAKAIPKVLQKCNLKQEDINLWEINEAFSAVVLANLKLLNLSIEKVNIHGGAVSMGHPIGMSGCRIVGHLVHTLKTGELGCAAICNGGGGASAMIIQKL